MNRRLVWLALPILLLALVWGVKWRTEHPTPTKEDVAVRALLMKSSRVEVVLVPYIPPLRFSGNPAPYRANLSKKDLKEFSDT